jgi:hypothetical protein
MSSVLAGNPQLDPGDLFAHVYDQLQACEPYRVDLDDWFHDPKFARAVKAEVAGIRSRGSILASRAKVYLESPKSAFQLLLALDRAFRYIDPIKDAGSEPGLEPLRQRWHTTGKLNTTVTSGSVIFRRGYPARPQGVPDGLEGYLRGVLRVPAGAPGKLKIIPGLVDFDPASRLDNLTFGCVSFIRGLGDLNIARINQGTGWYSIRVDDEDAALWDGRITAALAALDDSGAHVGVLPELVLTDRLLDLWLKTIRRNPPPAPSRLSWILVGTGPVGAKEDQPPNRAVVVNRRTGTVVFEQDKQNPFTLADSHITKWGLKDPLAPGPLGEWMKEGKTRFVVEASVGRFVVCICEDLGRAHEVITEIEPWGVSHVMVPIFSEPIRPYFWEQNSAERITNQVGSGVVVANSQAIELDGVRKNVSTAIFVHVAADASGPARDWSVKCEHSDIDKDPLKVQLGTLPCA